MARAPKTQIKRTSGCSRPDRGAVFLLSLGEELAPGAVADDG